MIVTRKQLCPLQENEVSLVKAALFSHKQPSESLLLTSRFTNGKYPIGAEKHWVCTGKAGHTHAARDIPF